MNKKLLISLAAIAVLAGTASSYSIGQAKAQEENSNFPNAIQALVDRFNLNENDVEEVITEQRVLMNQNRLDQFVNEGKLTEEQKNALLDKKNQHREEMQNWMDENEIDPEELGFGNKGGMHRGMMWGSE